jgi:hypothetical protein
MAAKVMPFYETTKNNAVESENKSLIVNDLTPYETATPEAPKTRINLPVPYGSERLNVPVCICNGLSPKIANRTTLGGFIDSLRTTDPLSISTAQSLKNAYLLFKETGDKKPYDAIKQGLKGVVFGDYSTRKDNDCISYIGLIGIDIDGYEDALQMSFDLATLKTNDFVFAAFPSPSGHGLRVLVFTDSTFDTHKATYKAVLQYLGDFLNLTTDKDKTPHLDAATSNPSRVWFFTATTDVYTNLESQVFTPSVIAAIETATPAATNLNAPIETTATETATETATPAATNPNAPIEATATETATPSKTFKKPHTHDGALTDAEKITACTEMSKRRNNSDGSDGRNNFVFSTACLCVEYGVSTDAILSHFTATYGAEDFTDAEIQKTVNSAVKRAQFGKFTDAQLKAYLHKVNGSQDLTAPVKTSYPDLVTTVKGDPSVSKAKTPKKAVETTDTAPDADDSDEYDYDFSEGETPKIELIEDYLTRRYDLRYNIVSNDVEISKRGKNDFETVNEDELICELLRTGLKGVDKPLLSLLKSKYPKQYNPLKAYFEDVHAKYQWKNGDFDHIAQLASHVKATDQYFFNTQFKKMLVRVVACAVGHIPFNKQCLTFVGKQNDGKTSFVRFLMPKFLKDYIKENLDFDKDGRLALCQNLIINLDELASLSRNDINQVKTYFTVETVKDRPPYGRKPVPFKRTASFFASTNNNEFLTDETGNVRWLVFDIDGFNFSYRQSVKIDAVWSQAYSLLQSGFESEMTGEEITHSEMNNQRFKRSYTELELLQRMYTPSKKGEPNAIFMQANEIKESLEIGHTTRKLNHITMAKALRDLNFDRVREYNPIAKYNIYGFFVAKII